MRTLYFNILITILIASFQSCTTDTGNTSIELQMPDAPTQMIYLQEWTKSGYLTVDSAILEDGQMLMKAELSGKNFYKLDIDYGKQISLILESGDQISVQGSFENPEASYTVANNPESEHLRLVLQAQYAFVVSQDSLQQQKNYFQSVGDGGNLYLAHIEGKELEERYKERLSQLINGNPSSLANAAALNDLNISTDLATFQKVRDSYKTSIPESEFYKNLNLRVSAFERTAIGALAPEITLPNPSGEMISLASLKGKYVLLDFWAAWCRPCRMENPNVVEMYNLYNEKGFEVFSVSLDGTPRQGANAKQLWLQAITQDKLSWPYHVSDLSGWNSNVVQTYQVEAIPFSLLLDPEGKIIAKNLRGPELKNELATIFNAL